MSDRVLRLYHRLPPPVRSVAATLRGLYLRWWRYGGVTERLVEAALERDHWSPEQWRAWREERLAYVLHRAATQVPYYREQWQARRRRGDHASWELLHNWPILEKEALREHPIGFVADDCDVRRMFREQTSGTTGKPLRLWNSRQMVRELYALADARTLRWYGVSRREPWARLGGQLVVPPGQRRPPFWVWNAALRQLYLSTYHLAPDLVPSYLDALVRYRITSLHGYSSSIYALAQAALRLKRSDLKMRVAVTNAEPLGDDQREVIAAAFQCPVRETYGMCESAAAASECEGGKLHQWPEVGSIEVLDGDQPVADGAFGEFVCTGLLNADMPLVRYRVGDCGSLAADGTPCRCGRSLPMIARVEGRTNDLLITRDGRRVFWLNPVWYGIPVRQGQIVQETLDRIRVRYAPAPDFTADAARTVVERLRERMGDVEVLLEQVEEVPRTANGKLRAVICNLPAAEREAALQ